MRFWQEALERQPSLASTSDEFHNSVELIVTCLKAHGTLLVCGNGGSAADALHFVAELRKSYLLERTLSPELKQALIAQDNDLGNYLANHLQRSVRALSLVNESALMTAVANDNGADLVFAQQIIDFAKPGDVLLAISTSGNSRNVVLAILTAKALGLNTVGLTGPKVSRMSELCDITLRAPGDHTQRIQESHLHIHHALCATIEAKIYGS